MGLYMKEIWKDVPNWENKYQVSNFGRAFSKLKNKIKPLDINNYGYARLQCYDGKRREKLFIHQLVGKLFVSGYQEGYVIDHIDGDKSNNIYTNLQWVSRSENSKRAFKNDLKEAKKKDQPCYLFIGENKVYFERITDAAKSIGINEKRLHHLLRTQNGYIPELGIYIFRCVSND